jgi:hypothetical protein
VIDSKLSFECNSHTIEAREESRLDGDVPNMKPIIKEKEAKRNGTGAFLGLAPSI